MIDQESLYQPVDTILRDDVFATVLPDVRLGPDEDLFAAGGDSLQLIRLVAQANAAFAVEIDAARFFERPTRAVLVRLVIECLSGTAGETSQARHKD